MKMRMELIENIKNDELNFVWLFREILYFLSTQEGADTRGRIIADSYKKLTVSNTFKDGCSPVKQG